MSQTLLYKNLFEVNILHHFFLNKGEQEWDKMSQEEKDKMLSNYDIREVFDIVPTQESTNALNAHHCIFKKTAKGVLVGVKAKPDQLNPGKFNSFIPLADNLTFRFLLKLRDLNFMNYSALPLQENRGKMLVFSNSLNNSSNTFPSLSVIPPVYNPGNTYLPGDMLSDHATNPTKLYTALVKTGADPTLSADWLTENGNITTPLSYANVNDSYQVANGFFTYTMKVKDAKPVATIKNSAGLTIQPKMEVLPGEFYSLQVDLLKYPQGIYSIHIDSDDPTYHDDVTFYLLQGSETPFALIEIKVKGNQPSYNLFDQGDLLSPTYVIRFRNRKTHWKYIGKLFDSPYVLQDPLPLTRYGNIEIMKPPEPEDTKTIMLPNPSVSLIKAEALIHTEEKKYYSEIHIN
jgi:hypothetical protein